MYIQIFSMRRTDFATLKQSGNISRHAGGESHFVRFCRCFLLYR